MPTGRIRASLVAGVLLLGTTAAADSQCQEAAPGLKDKAKVSCVQALAAARAKFKSAKVESAELEEENGRLVYSFDLRTKGTKGADEVQVDAMTGEVVSVQHESPAQESAEKDHEKGKSSKGGAK